MHIRNINSRRSQVTGGGKKLFSASTRARISATSRKQSPLQMKIEISSLPAWLAVISIFVYSNCSRVMNLLAAISWQNFSQVAGRHFTLVIRTVFIQTNVSKPR